MLEESAGQRLTAAELLAQYPQHQIKPSGRELAAQMGKDGLPGSGLDSDSAVHYLCSSYMKGTVCWQCAASMCCSHQRLGLYAIDDDLLNKPILSRSCSSKGLSEATTVAKVARTLRECTVRHHISLLS
eukprot:1711679-Amphidinium_carterae.1